MMQQTSEQGASTPSDPGGLFVLSLPRTGSTLLRVILDTHPDVYCPDEIYLGRLLHALYDTNEGLAEISRTSPSVSAADVDPASPPAVVTRRIVSHLVATAARRKGKALWCDKSPNNLEHRDLIARLLPDARFILLHRHCLDFAMSCLRASFYGFFLDTVEDYVRKNHRNFLPALVQAWEEKTEGLLAFEAEHGGRCLRLCYEDLVTAPAESLARICEFLGVAFDQRILETVFSSPHPQRSYRGDPAVLFARTIVDRSVGSGAELKGAAVKSLPADLLRRMNERLDSLGYPAVELTASGFDMHAGRRLAGAAPAGSGAPAVVEGKAAPDVRGGTAAEFFAAVAERLRANPDLAGKLNSSFKFVLTGKGGGTWLLDLTSSPGSVISDGDGASAHYVITTSIINFAEIVTGKLNAAAVFFQGRLNVQGPLDEATLRDLIGVLVQS